MQAIDFATRFFKSVIKHDLTHNQMGALLGVAAGLDTAYDIASFYEQENVSIIKTALNKLVKRGLLTVTIDDFAGVDEYHLADEGKELVKSLFLFLPKR